MKSRTAWFALCLLPLPLVAQAPDVITMDQEPHHHLSLKNDFVKVFKVEVAPGDSIVLHRHDQDTVAIAIGEQLVTIGVPGKPDVHQKNADAQVRLQRGGYVHSTRVDGSTPYHTVAVELLRPQTNFHNVCAEILAGQPLNCSDSPFWTGNGHSVVYFSLPMLESNETHVRLVRVGPHHPIDITDIPTTRDAARVVVALDPLIFTSGSAKKSQETLRPGDFNWMDAQQHDETAFESVGDKDARLLDIILQSSH